MFSVSRIVVLAPSEIELALVRTSQGALPELVPRNITPVWRGRGGPPVEGFGPTPEVPSAWTCQPVSSACQRVKPPLTTYDRFPEPLTDGRVFGARQDADVGRGDLQIASAGSLWADGVSK